MTELDTLKKNRINILQRNLNVNLARLKNNLLNTIKNIKKTRWDLKVKQNRINKAINDYKNSVNVLKQNFNSEVEKIQSFFPDPVLVNRNKKALLIGINYTGTENELYGCINDTNTIKNRLLQNGFQENDINILTDLTPITATKDNILYAFKNLLINSQEGDLLFLLYSGHGSYTYDNNNDETTGYDQLIVPCDLNIIVDDELKSIIQTYLKEKVTLFAMFDSCFSGSVLDLRYQYMDSLNYDNFTENTKELETKGNVFMISGCSDYQTSADTVINNKATGAMTWALNDTLNTYPNCSWRNLVKHMRNLLRTSEYDQIPQFSSGTFEDIDTQVFI